MPNGFFESIDALCQDAHSGFDDALDYIWKTPEFLALQEQIEQRKLEEDYSHIRDFRWSLESRKLYRVFPMLMANGNLFASTSLFEIYVLQLAKLIEDRTGTSMPNGQGVTRHLAYLRESGIESSAPVLWPQVNSALKIRHSLMHASGLLVDSRDRAEIHQIVRSKTYLSRLHRSRPVEDDGPMVEIVPTRFGERLQIKNYYAWLQTAYLRDYFLDLSKLAADRLGEELRPR